MQILTEVVVQDLNANPKLLFDENSFDAITNAVWGVGRDAVVKVIVFNPRGSCLCSCCFGLLVG